MKVKYSQELKCVFEDDGRPLCLRKADWWVGKHTLCDFHKGFMYSVDYGNELPKPRKVK